MTTTLLDETLALLAQEGVKPGQFAGFSDKDALLVVDMQNDFLPAEAATDGGRFGVAEGQHAIPSITKLIDDAVAKKAVVYATRDYHPLDHCSFSTNGGPFPPHCIQGSTGSFLCKEVAAALQPHVASGAAKVVFKAFTKDCDSFGGFEYAEDALEEGGRLSANRGNAYCKVCWTGSYVLFSSNMATDCNAPPDVMSVLEKQALKDALPPAEGRVVYCCGLAMDFCVLDSAVTATRAGHKAVIVVNASRAAHIPGLGTHGTGFLSDPKAVAAELTKHNIDLVVV